MIFLYECEQIESIDPPLYGYDVTVNMPVHIVKCSDGSYKSYDAGATYDYRTCKMNIDVPAATATTLIAWFRSTARGETFTLRLGDTATGFCPFGPDKGDLGDFTVRVINFTESSWKEEPYGYIQIAIEMAMVTAPEYTPGAGRTEGPTQIGTVAGLRWPDPGYTPEPEYAIYHTLTRSGVPYTVDASEARDRYTSELVLPCCTVNAALVAQYIVGTGRGGNITIIPGANGYMFGATEQSSGAGTYVTRLILGGADGTQLVMRHANWDNWKIPLKFWMVSRS